MRATSDLLSIVEASYALDQSEGDWLSGLARAVYEHSGLRTLGAYAQTYRWSAGGALSVGDIRFASDRCESLRALHDELGAYYMTRPERIRATYGETDEGLALSLPGEHATIRAMFSTCGVGDMYGINARSLSGEGCLLCVYLPPRHRPIQPKTRQAFARIARHVSTALRLRGRLSANDAAPDAIVDARGVVQHAAGDAKKKEAREALRTAAKALLRTRGARRAREPERDVAAWKALVAARWSLVDHFERDGSFYLVAHRNDAIGAPIALLSERERQVVALAALGLANKMIAYELGIATSTVGVLVSRAMARLGVRSRRQLATTYLAATRRSSEDR